MTKTIDRRYNKKSFQALNVANEVIQKIKNNEKINLSEIQVRNGYSVKSARAQKAIKTKTFQKAVIPVIERMKAVHEKAITDLERRDLSEERMDSVVNLAKQMVHDTQLLSGKSTENLATNVIVYGNDDFLTQQIERNSKPDTTLDSSK